MIAWKSLQAGKEKLSKRNYKQVALNSLREGLSVETVARITGLKIEQVQQLQVQLQATNE